MGYYIQRATAAKPLLFLMVDSTDHISGKAGLAPTVTLSKNGAAFAAPAGAVTELANGWYAVAANATDNATLGPLLLHATATGADPCDEAFAVVAFNPDDAAALGLSNLNATISSRLATAGYTAPPDAATIAGAVRTNLTTELGRIDTTISSRAAPGAAMTLTSGERTAVANEIEAQIIDDTDTEKVLKAITDKIAAANPDLSGLTVGAIASAVWNATERTLSAFGFTVSTSPVTLAAAQSSYAPLKATDYVAPNNAGIGTAAAAAAAALVAAEAAQDAALAAQAAAAAAATPGDVAGLINALKGAGWTTETLKAIYDKPGASLSPEQLAEMAAAVIAALNTDGVTVSGFLAAALGAIRNAVAGAVIQPQSEWQEGELTVWLGDRYGSEFGRPITRTYPLSAVPWLDATPTRNVLLLVQDELGNDALLIGTATIADDLVTVTFGALSVTWGLLRPGEATFRVVQRFPDNAGGERQTLEGGRCLLLAPIPSTC